MQINIQYKNHWQNIYEKKDEKSLSWFQKNASPSINLIQKYIDKNHKKFIDIGAGTSRLVDKIIKIRNIKEISLLDISSKALSINKKRLPQDYKINYITSEITQWKHDNIFDIWHDRAVFHFILSEEHIKKYLSVLDLSTRSGSIIIIGTFCLDGPDKCSGLEIKKYSSKTLHSILGNKFNLLESLDHDHYTPNDKLQKFSFSVFKKSIS
mgnify:CR=1 FL=1